MKELFTGHPKDVVPHILEHIDAMVALWTRDEACVFANTAYCDWFGKTRQEMSGITIEQLLGAGYGEILPFLAAAFDGKKQIFERLATSPDGHRHALTTYTPYMHEGQVTGIFEHLADVTPLKTLEKELETDRWRLDAILKSTNTGAWEWNIRTGAIVCNERWAEIVGYRLDDLRPLNIDTWRRLSHPEDLKRSGEQLERHFRRQTEFYEFEGRLKHRLGHWVWVLDKGKVLAWTDAGEPLMMYGAHQDITERKERELAIASLTLRLEALAITDELTGLLNRRGWEECISREERRAQRYGNDVCVFMLDLDDLKKINDSQGHEAGDQLLKRFSQCLRTAMREVDAVARIGGDEFAAMATACSSGAGSQLQRRIADTLAREGISASWGMAVRDPEVGMRGAVREADRRMYEMKTRRRADALAMDAPKPSDADAITADNTPSACG